MKLAARTVCLVMVGLAASIVPAMAAEWQALGERIVDFRTNPETVVAKVSEATFSKIKIEVKQTNIEIQNLKVVFDDGQSFDVALNKYMGAGSSRIVDLPTAKVIQRVEFSYRPASAGSKIAIVRVLGSN
jgi:ribosomal protein S4E